MRAIDRNYTNKYYEFKYTCGKMYLAGHGVDKYVNKEDSTKIRLVHTTIGGKFLSYVNMSEDVYESIVDSEYETISDSANFVNYLLSTYFNY